MYGEKQVVSKNSQLSYSGGYILGKKCLETVDKTDDSYLYSLTEVT